MPSTLDPWFATNERATTTDAATQAERDERDRGLQWLGRVFLVSAGVVAVVWLAVLL